MIHPPAFSSLKEPEQELRRTVGLLGTGTKVAILRSGVIPGCSRLTKNTSTLRLRWTSTGQADTGNEGAERQGMQSSVRESGRATGITVAGCSSDRRLRRVESWERPDLRLAIHQTRSEHCGLTGCDRVSSLRGLWGKAGDPRANHLLVQGEPGLCYLGVQDGERRSPAIGVAGPYQRETKRAKKKKLILGGLEVPSCQSGRAHISFVMAARGVARVQERAPKCPSARPAACKVIVPPPRTPDGSPGYPGRA